METTSIKNFRKTPHIHSSNVFKEIGRNAYVDWLLILFLNTLILICLTIGGVYLYFVISTGDFILAEDSSKINHKFFDEKQLDSLINKFQAKEGISTQARMGYRGVGDPSL